LGSEKRQRHNELRDVISVALNCDLGDQPAAMIAAVEEFLTEHNLTSKEF
jgi:hypothetical protein